MNVLVIGSGGREFTIGRAIKESKEVDRLYFVPGNGGTNLLGENIDLHVLDFGAIAEIIEHNEIKMVVVGPEIPLVEGIVDFLQLKFGEQLLVVGPSQKGALLEGSKAFAKAFMQKYNIPTAKYMSFAKDGLVDAIEFLKSLNSPYVLKADGLAAGKGVFIIDNVDEAVEQLQEFFKGKFGEASEIVVIEEFLKGIELTVFVATDGTNYKILPTAKDYKRIGNNDTGLNTGGMGAVAPVPFANAELMQKIEHKVIIPTIKGLQNEKILYKGFIYCGLMIVDGEPFVIEYNCRLGDPETQVVLPLIKSDFFNVLKAIAKKDIANLDFEVFDKTALTVVLSSKGYPEKFQKHKQITIENKDKDVLVIHAGTTLENDKFYSNAGRVVCITTLSDDIEHARQKVYKEIENIKFENKYYRTDIGLDLLKFEL